MVYHFLLPPYRVILHNGDGVILFRGVACFARYVVRVVVLEGDATHAAHFLVSGHRPPSVTAGVITPVRAADSIDLSYDR